MVDTSEATVHNAYDHTDLRLVDVTVNNKPVQVPAETTGAQILSRADLPADYNLFIVQGDHEDPVDKIAPIKVHEREKFVATPPLEPS